MEEPIWQDEFDWRGCAAAQFDPEKLGGRGNVGLLDPSYSRPPR